MKSLVIKLYQQWQKLRWHHLTHFSFPHYLGLKIIKERIFCRLLIFTCKKLVELKLNFGGKKIMLRTTIIIVNNNKIK